MSLQGGTVEQKCPECASVNADQAVYYTLSNPVEDRVISGTFCSVECFLTELDNDFYMKEKLDNKKEFDLFNDIETFLGNKDYIPNYYVFLPSNIVNSSKSVKNLNKVFKNTSVISLKEKILCYWLSCMPGMVNYNVSNEKNISFPKNFLNGVTIVPNTDKVDSHKAIIVSSVDFGESFVCVAPGENGEQVTKTIYSSGIEFSEL